LISSKQQPPVCSPAVFSCKGLFHSLDDLVLVHFEIHPIPRDVFVGEHPDMCVGYLVTNHFAQDEISVKCLPLCQGHFFSNLEIRAYVLVIPYPAIVFLGYYLCVTWRLWVYIEKCEEIVVFIDDVCRNLPSDDFAEDAVLHTCILQVSMRILQSACGI
jgi:hypothetical protein